MEKIPLGPFKALNGLKEKIKNSLIKGDRVNKEEIFIHELVPKHEILSKEEKEKLLSNLKITPEQLPRILEDDPVAVEIGAKSGDILKIIRKSETAGESIYYRLVVSL